MLLQHGHPLGPKGRARIAQNALVLVCVFSDEDTDLFSAAAVSWVSQQDLWRKLRRKEQDVLDPTSHIPRLGGRHLMLPLLDASGVLCRASDAIHLQLS